MSLHLKPVGDIPAETARVARAAFPKGTVAIRLRDEFSALYKDEDFRRFYPTRGQPALAPWRLALVTVLQFLEHLSDRQAADAVRARIDSPPKAPPGADQLTLEEFEGRRLFYKQDLEPRMIPGHLGAWLASGPRHDGLICARNQAPARALDAGCRHSAAA